MAQTTKPDARVQRVLRKMPEEYLMCRLMYSHPFQMVDYHELGFDDPPWGDGHGFWCPRCGMKRLDVWDIWGNLSYRRYMAPEGYHLEADLRPTVAECRQEMRRRMK